MNIQEYQEQVNIVHSILSKPGKTCTCTVSAYNNNDVKRVSNITLSNQSNHTTLKANEYLLGCPICDNTYTTPTKITDKFIQVSNIIYNNKYEYNLYPDNPLVFRCPDHGDQNMYSLKAHLLPIRDSSFIYGCPICYKQNTIFNRYIKQAEKYNNKTNFYLIQLEHKETLEVIHKVGVTFDTIPNRFKDWHMYNITVLVYKNINVQTALELEKSLKTIFIKENLNHLPPHAKERDGITYLGGASECIKISSNRIIPLTNYIIKQLNQGQLV